VAIEHQLSSIRRWLTALTIIIITLTFISILSLTTRWEHIRAHRIEVAPPSKPALIIFSTNPLGDPIILINDQMGRRRFGITLDKNGNAVLEWFATDGRTLKQLSIP